MIYGKFGFLKNMLEADVCEKLNYENVALLTDEKVINLLNLIQKNANRAAEAGYPGLDTRRRLSFLKPKEGTEHTKSVLQKSSKKTVAPEVRDFISKYELSEEN